MIALLLTIPLIAGMFWNHDRHPEHFGRTIPPPYAGPDERPPQQTVPNGIEAHVTPQPRDGIDMLAHLTPRTNAKGETVLGVTRPYTL